MQQLIVVAFNLELGRRKKEKGEGEGKKAQLAGLLVVKGVVRIAGWNWFLQRRKRIRWSRR